MWDDGIVMDGYKTEDLCIVLVDTGTREADGEFSSTGNCADFCSS